MDGSAKHFSVNFNAFCCILNSIRDPTYRKVGHKISHLHYRQREKKLLISLWVPVLPNNLNTPVSSPAPNECSRIARTPIKLNANITKVQQIKVRIWIRLFSEFLTFGLRTSAFGGIRCCGFSAFCYRCDPQLM